jgi:1-acyl-sn-glycerol-3-phosphate acyltransferase
VNYIIPLLTQKILWIPTRLLLRIFLRLKVVGKENLRGLDQSRGVLVVANHASQLDVPIIVASLSFFSPLLPIFFLSLEHKEYERFKLRRFYGGKMFQSLGGLPVTRGLKDYEKALKTHIECLERGCSLSIFPEGEVTRTGEISTPRPGVAYLATRTGAVVVPVAIKGTYRLNLAGFLLRRKRVEVVFGRPFHYSGTEPREIMRHVEKLLRQ